MIDDIRRRLEENSFRPFTIVTSGGSKYHVPSGDHASINPRGNRVVIWFDEGGSVIVASLHITAIEEETSAPHDAKFRLFAS